MSKEVFEMLCAMDRRQVELQIVLQCAPTLAGLKISNLLILPRELEHSARYALGHIGLIGYRLAYDRQRVVMLVFKKEMLVTYIQKDEVRKFLKNFGYGSEGFGAALALFQRRYEEFVEQRENFPHEMGVFLGYPLCDVKGFIENKGNGFVLAGYWKVYGNVYHTRRLFKLFDDMKDDMVCMLSKGYTLEQIRIEVQNISLAG